MINGTSILHPEKAIKGVKKRNGETVDWQTQKVYDALFAAFSNAARLENKEVDKAVVKEVAGIVVKEIAAEGVEYPDVDYINKKAIEVARKKEYNLAANIFEKYSQERKEKRDSLKVVKVVNNSMDTTDTHLLVEGGAKSTLSGWDRSKIAFALKKEAGLDSDKSRYIAKIVEKKIIDSGLEMLTTGIIREFVDVALLQAGEEKRMKKQQILGVPTYDLEQLIFTKSVENSNIAANNPEAINLAIAEIILKKYALENIFSEEVTEAHLTGRIHLHDLGYPIRTYCSSHSLDYIKKYGLNLDSLTVKSSSPSYARTLTGHLNTFLATMQPYYAGALGIAFKNVFYAPLLKFDMEGKSEEEREKDMKQEAQYLIYSLSQSAFSRGGQALFIDSNMHTGVPKILREVPAIGPGGKYMIKRKKTIDDVVDISEHEVGDAEDNIFMSKPKKAGKTGHYEAKIEKDGKKKIIYLGEIPKAEKGRRLLLNKEHFEKKDDGMHFIREYDDVELVKEIQFDKDGNAIDPEDGTIMKYKDFEKEAREFVKAALKVWGDGDNYGKVFSFPKCDLHVNDETFSNPEQYKIFLYACEVASKNGSPYFFFDRNESQLSQCCRLRTTVTDDKMIKHPERMRFCGFQNITINLPQAAYRAGKGNLEGMIKDIEQSMEIAVQAHLQKKDFISKIMNEKGTPLWQVGKKTLDGESYVDLDKATYIIGIIGLNEAIQYATGKELHEGLQNGKEAYKDGLKVVAAMNLKAKELGAKTGLKLTLEESPAESAARRFVKTDLRIYPEQAKSVVKGDLEKDEMYYTNSIHFRADAPISLIERIDYQSRFHPLIEAGAIIHAFVGEKRPSTESIANLVEKTYKNTQCAQFVISPEFTYCNDCNHQDAGLKEKCGSCGSTNVDEVTRIVGYYSKVKDWNKSKKGELRDRQKAAERYVPA